MNNQKLMWGVGGVLLGLVFSGVFFSPRMGMMGGYSRMGLHSGIDAHFIEQMISHHEDAITMAEIATTKAKHPEIKQLASDIQRTQSEEISEMQQWYKDWYGKDVPEVSAMMRGGRMHMGMMGNASDISRLQSATEFDQAFIEEMIPHHQMAVMMANMLLSSTDRPEMKQLAQKIIDVQTREIDSMRGWYTAWYGGSSF